MSQNNSKKIFANEMQRQVCRHVITSQVKVENCLQTLVRLLNLKAPHFVQIFQLLDGFLARISGAVSRQNPKFHCFTLCRTYEREINLRNQAFVELRHTLHFLLGTLKYFLSVPLTVSYGVFVE